jgi:restriction endonuclease
MRLAILRELYEATFGEGTLEPASQMANRYGWNQDATNDVVFDLLRSESVRRRDSAHLKILPAGVKELEEAGAAPPDLFAACNASRIALLAEYQRLADAEGMRGTRHFRELVGTVAAANQLRPMLVRENLELLLAAGMIENQPDGFYRIAESGSLSFRRWREREGLSARYKALPPMAPRERGMEFQSLFGDLARFVGMTAGESVRTTGEELDFVLQDGSHFYLVECRWKQRRTPTREMRDFCGKVVVRPPSVEGLFVSMSGFAEGAVKYAQDHLDKRTVMLMGPQDVAGVFASPESLRSVLEERRNGLILRRTANWS